MKKNVKVSAAPVLTHGGVPAMRINAEQQLRRSVMATLLWEDQFYEDGQAIGDRIASLATQVAPDKVAAIAVEAREVHHLRHVPLLLASALVRPAAGSSLVSQLLPRLIQRPDELGEFLSLYWSKGRTPIAKQVKAGLAKALQRFDAYQLAKYDAQRAIKLRDILFLTHAKPKDEAQAAVWKQLVDGTLPAPDTWEQGLMRGQDKRETFERLLREGKLGYMALLRNLRGMQAAGVDEALVREAIVARKGADKVLPFRFIAAARAAPDFERELDAALQASVASAPQFSGSTAILVDVSGSMDVPISARSDLRRIDAAAALAAVFPGNVKLFSFSDRLVSVPPRRGMAGVDAIIRSQPHSGTALASAVSEVNTKGKFERMVVITDEQATDRAVPNPVVDKAYMINVASARNGVGYGKWTHLDGFSEGVLRWMAQHEQDK